MAGRLLANLIVMGGAVVGRAVLQAYRQAIVSHNLGLPTCIVQQFQALCLGLLMSPDLDWIDEIPHMTQFRDANKTGAAQEAIHGIRRASQAMTEQEARQILGISEQSTWAEFMQKYDTMFERNAKNGSFYLQSKVHRAKECLEAVYEKPDVTN